MRKHYIDNARWLAIALLFPYHVFMIYNNWGEQFYIKGINSLFISNIIVLIWPWFMPLLFCLSGIGALHSLEKRTSGEYIKERISKLLIPLISSILLIVPSMSFFADKYHNGYSGNYLQHYFVFFTRFTDLSGYDGGFAIGHLWFVLYLFAITVITFPLISLKKKIPTGNIKRLLQNFSFETATDEKRSFAAPRGEKLQDALRQACCKTNRVLQQALNIVVLLLLFLIPLLGQVILDISGKSLGEYLAFFLIGYYLFSDDGVLEKFEKNKVLLYVIFLGCMILIIMGFNKIIILKDIVLDIIAGLYAYIGVIIFIITAKKHFNKNNKTFSYLSKSSFGIYIFHQIWIVIIAYYVFKYTNNMLLQITVILLCSIILTYGTYEIIKRIKLIRLLFGIKR